MSQVPVWAIVPCAALVALEGKIWAQTKKTSFNSRAFLWMPQLTFRPGNSYGYGSKLSHQGTAGCSPCVHLPGFHFGYLFLTQPYAAPAVEDSASRAYSEREGSTFRQPLSTSTEPNCRSRIVFNKMGVYFFGLGTPLFGYGYLKGKRTGNSRHPRLGNSPASTCVAQLKYHGITSMLSFNLDSTTDCLMMFT